MQSLKVGDLAFSSVPGVPAEASTSCRISTMMKRTGFPRIARPSGQSRA